MVQASFETSMAHVLQAHDGPGQPLALYRALDQEMGRLIGHRLFTLMVFDDRGRTVQRVYSNQPVAYPVGGSKPYTASTVFDRLLRDREPYIAYTAADIEQAFTDHATIAGLGCAAGLHLPVAYDGRALGLMNLLDAAGRYDTPHVALAAPFAALLALPFLQTLRGHS